MTPGDGLLASDHSRLPTCHTYKLLQLLNRLLPLIYRPCCCSLVPCSYCCVVKQPTSLAAALPAFVIISHLHCNHTGTTCLSWLPWSVLQGLYHCNATPSAPEQLSFNTRDSESPMVWYS